MCGRYELHSNPSAIALAFGLAYPPDVQARYNIAPMTDVPIVRVATDGQHRELVRMRWGLVPRWAKDPSVGARMINARGETLADRPSFQMPYRRHRCLLPADGFYEWQPVARSAGAEDKRKQPMHIGMADGSLFGLAGLFERWRSEDGTVLDTCAIVTTEANALLAPIHDRMPVIIGPDEFARWLDPSNADVADLIAPYPSSAMACYPVSLRVNTVRNDDAALLERVEPLAIDASEAEDAPTVPEQESLF